MPEVGGTMPVCDVDNRAALSHPVSTGISREHLGSLIEELAGPWAARHNYQQDPSGPARPNLSRAPSRKPSKPLMQAYDRRPIPGHGRKRLDA